MEHLNCIFDFLEKDGHLSKTADKVTIDFKGKLFLSFIMSSICLAVYLANAVIFGFLSKTYKNLNLKEKMFWNLAVVRSVYGIFGTVTSGYERYFDESIKADILNGQSLNSTLLLTSHMGFFIFECSAQTYFDVRFKTFSKALHAHHLLALVGYFLVLYNNVNHYLGVSVFILEASTPFSCICWCLIKAEMGKSALWKANQFLLVHIFHLRSVFEFTMIYEVVMNWNTLTQMPILLFINQVGGLFIVAFILTPYWKYRKTEQMFSGEDWNSQENKKKKEK